MTELKCFQLFSNFIYFIISKSRVQALVAGANPAGLGSFRSQKTKGIKDAKDQTVMNHDRLLYRCCLGDILFCHYFLWAPNLRRGNWANLQVPNMYEILFSCNCTEQKLHIFIKASFSVYSIFYSINSVTILERLTQNKKIFLNALL